MMTRTYIVITVNYTIKNSLSDFSPINSVSIHLTMSLFLLFFFYVMNFCMELSKTMVSFT